MDFVTKYLKETLEAINYSIEKNYHTISTKLVKKYQEIKPKDHSKTNFIWRSLEFLEKQDILEVNGSTSPKLYNIKPREKISIDNFIRQIKKEH